MIVRVDIIGNPQRLRRTQRRRAIAAALRTPLPGERWLLAAAVAFVLLRWVGWLS